MMVCPKPSSNAHRATGDVDVEQVARYLLEHGLPNMEGVVFLDSLDRKMILCRSGMKVVKLSQCKIPLEKRFTFYDQVCLRLNILSYGRQLTLAFVVPGPYHRHGHPTASVSGSCPDSRQRHELPRLCSGASRCQRNLKDLALRGMLTSVRVHTACAELARGRRLSSLSSLRWRS
jgi:hypothetical protein